MPELPLYRPLLCGVQSPRLGLELRQIPLGFELRSLVLPQHFREVDPCQLLLLLFYLRDQGRLLHARGLTAWTELAFIEDRPDYTPLSWRVLAIHRDVVSNFQSSAWALHF